MNSALYPGSFDPFTNGHLSVLEKAVNIFDEIVIAISQNPTKKPRFDVCIRYYTIYQALCKKSYFNKIKIIMVNDTLPARIAETYKCQYIIRGLRNNMDYNYEEALALFNSEYSKKIETIYFRADNAAISSTMVYSFYMDNVSIKKYVPYNTKFLSPKLTIEECAEIQSFAIEHHKETEKWLLDYQE